MSSAPSGAINWLFFVPDNWLNELPPWKAFPGLSPSDLGARQGAQEWYSDTVWRPFWNGLTEDQRGRYHQHWQTEPVWRMAIGRLVFTESAEEIAAEARESDAFLQRWREERQRNAKASLLARLRSAVALWFCS